MSHETPPQKADTLDPLNAFMEAETLDELKEKLQALHEARLTKLEVLRQRIADLYSDDLPAGDAVREQLNKGEAELKRTHRVLMNLIEDAQGTDITPRSLLQRFRQMAH